MKVCEAEKLIKAIPLEDGRAITAGDTISFKDSKLGEWFNGALIVDVKPRNKRDPNSYIEFIEEGREYILHKMAIEDIEELEIVKSPCMDVLKEI